jgi:hypothetical protein
VILGCRVTLGHFGGDHATNFVEASIRSGDGEATRFEVTKHFDMLSECERFLERVTGARVRNGEVLLDVDTAAHGARQLLLPYRIAGWAGIANFCACSPDPGRGGCAVLWWGSDGGVARTAAEPDAVPMSPSP